MCKNQTWHSTHIFVGKSTLATADARYRDILQLDADTVATSHNHRALKGNAQLEEMGGGTPPLLK